MPENHSGTAPHLMITAAEAYPVLERCFLGARESISAGFRVFDPATRLRSEEALSVGKTWADLVAHTLARGIRFRLILSDFDPVVRPALHRATWRSAHQLRKAAIRAGRPELLEVIPSMHASRLGIVPRLFFWPKILGEIREELDRLNAGTREEAEADLALMPGLAPHIRGTHPDLKVRPWPIPPLVPATHHQKVAVFDDDTLFIGGLDLDDRRFDTPEHDQPGPETWADMQILLHGPVANAARRHLDELRDVVAGKKPPSHQPRLLRTLSTRRERQAFRMSPKTVLSEIETAHREQIAQAETLIYLETQFLRSRPIAQALARRARENPDLQVLLVLPAAPEEVAFEGARKGDSRYGEYLQAKCVEMVGRAFGPRAFFMAPGQPRETLESGRATVAGAPLIYLHSKVSVFDETTAIISSANLNGRSMRWDTEVGVLLEDPATVRELRSKCLRHWLPDQPEERYLGAATLVSAFRDLAHRNANTPPEDRIGFVLPYPLAPAKRFGRNLPGVPEEVV